MPFADHKIFLDSPLMLHRPDRLSRLHHHHHRLPFKPPKRRTHRIHMCQRKHPKYRKNSPINSKQSPMTVPNRCRSGMIPRIFVRMPKRERSFDGGEENKNKSVKSTSSRNDASSTIAIRRRQGLAKGMQRTDDNTIKIRRSTEH